MEKVSKFLNITKAYIYKEKFFSANRASRYSQNNRQIIIVYGTCLKKQKKTEKLQKLRRIVPMFAIFCHISQQKMIHIQNCPYLLLNN